MSGNWAISTYVDEIYGPRRMDEALALVERCGVKYVDPRIVDDRNSFMAVGNDELRRFKEKLDRHGLKVAALGSPLFKTSLKGTQPKVFGSRHGFDLDASKSFEDHLKLLPRAFEIAEMFQADNIRIFAFWREHSLDDVFDEVVDKLGRAVRLAEKAGHTLSLENEMKTMAGTGAELARILKAFNSPRLSGTYDVGNAGRLDAKVYPDDYEPLKGRLGHIHVKFERIDVSCGWPSGGYESYDDASTAWRERVDVPIIAWGQHHVPIDGQLQVGSRSIRVKGRRTHIAASESVNIDYRGFFKALKRDSYNGFIAIDSKMWDLSDVAADFQHAVDDLRMLIAEVQPVK